MCAGYTDGHHYSPIPSPDDIARVVRSDADLAACAVPGIDMQEEEQLAYLRTLAPYYRTQPFSQHKEQGRLYYCDNPMFECGDAFLLQAVLRHEKPTRIIEVGGGFSTAAICDTNRLFLDNHLQHTCIEPYPEHIYDLFEGATDQLPTILQQPIQDIDLDVFTTLSAGDILFIDSSHVAKAGSDVQDIFTRVLPSLQPGVRIHFHDISYPFEYPEFLLKERKCYWNEAYILHAFLQCNSAFRITIFNHFLRLFHEEELLSLLPYWSTNSGGSIWIERV